MLSRSEIEGVAATRTHGNVGHAEKLYLQDVILSTISRETADQLVFKGDTSLLKLYQLDRFSEDLDFTATEPIEVAEIVTKSVRDLDQYGATVAERREEETGGGFHARLGIQGPLYTGDRLSLCFVRIEVNTKSTASNVRIHRYTPPFADISSFDLAVLDEAKILAEKIRALVTKDRPRDLYDIYYLLEKSVRVDPPMVQKKLVYYGLTYDPDAVIVAAERPRAPTGRAVITRRSRRSNPGGPLCVDVGGTIFVLLEARTTARLRQQPM